MIDKLIARLAPPDVSSLIHNIGWLGATSVAVKPVWFVFITVLCVRVLGPAEYGMLTTALSLAAIAFSVTGLGMEEYTVREVARNRNLAPTFLTNFLALRVGLVLLAGTIALATALLLDYGDTLLLAVAFACIYQGAFSLLLYVRKFFWAYEILKYDGLSLIVEKALVIAGGAVLLLTTQAPQWTVLGMAAGMLAATVATFAWTIAKLVPFRTDLFSPAFIGRALTTTIPFGLAAIFGLLYFRTDLLMVERMIGAEEAGQYGLAFRVVEALNMLPLIVGRAAIFPRTSRLYEQQKHEQFRHLMRVSLVGLGAASLCITAVLSWTAPTLVTLMAGDPALDPAGTTLRLLAWTFPFACLRILLHVTLLAMDEQRFVAYIMGGAMVLNISLNIVLIPAIGILGAAAATVGAEVVLMLTYAIRYWHRSRALGDGGLNAAIPSRSSIV